MSSERFQVSVTRTLMTTYEMRYVSFLVRGASGMALFLSGTDTDAVTDSESAQSTAYEMHTYLPLRKNEAVIGPVLAGSQISMTRRPSESATHFNSDIIEFVKNMSALGYSDLPKNLIKHLIGPPLSELALIALRYQASLQKNGNDLLSIIRKIESTNTLFLNFKSSLSSDLEQGEKVYESMLRNENKRLLNEEAERNRKHYQDVSGFGAF